MKTRNIDLKGPEGNVFCVIGITFNIVLESKGLEAAQKFSNRLLNDPVGSYDEALNICQKQAEECGTKLVYENKYL